MRKLLLLVLFISVTAVSYAGGYRVSLQGQRAIAMGHTGVAFVNSAELVFFNPAGLVYLEDKLNVSGGASAVFADVIYQNSDLGITSETDNGLGTPLNLYGSYKVNDWMSVGLGVYTPYGSGVTWPTDWAGSHLVNNIDLAAIYIQPVVSFKLSDMFSIGGGPIYVTGSVNFNRNASRTFVDFDGNRSNITLDATGISNWGWSIGGMFSPTENFRFGFNYRSEIIMEVEDGDATFSNFPNSTNPSVPTNGQTTFNAELPLPAELTLGISYTFLDKWTVAFDYNRQFWDVYESLDIEFGNGSNSFNPRNYKNSDVIRFGAQYEATDKIVVRGGFYVDKTPVQSGFYAPETPRNDSTAFTGGVSYQITPKIGVDVSFLYVRFEEINESYDYVTDPSTGAISSFGGTYKSGAFAPGLGLTYKL